MECVIFLSRSILAHLFCNLIISWMCRLFLGPQTTTPFSSIGWIIELYMWNKVLAFSKRNFFVLFSRPSPSSLFFL